MTALPLLVAGSEGAQAVLDRFTTKSYQGAELLRPTHANALLALGGIGALLLGAGFVGHVVAGSRRRSVPVWTFALLPPLLYVVQEHVEYWVGHGGPTGSPATQPAFLLGLALQVPFAVAAYLAARLLMRLACALAERRVARCFTSPATTGRRGSYHDPWTRRARPGGTRVTRGPPLSTDSP